MGEEYPHRIQQKMRLLCGAWLCFVLEMIGGVRDSADLILPI